MDVSKFGRTYPDSMNLEYLTGVCSDLSRPTGTRKMGKNTVAMRFLLFVAYL
jgi:hypothetical protein